MASERSSGPLAGLKTVPQADLRWAILKAAKAGDEAEHLELRRQWWRLLHDTGLTGQEIRRLMGPKRPKAMPCSGCGADRLCAICEAEQM